MATKNPRIQALRMAAKAFLIIAAGGHLLPDEGKTFADLCCLAMPMKYRFTRQELGEISNSVKGVLHVERHPKGCECDRCAETPEVHFNEIDQKLERILGPVRDPQECRYCNLCSRPIHEKVFGKERAWMTEDGTIFCRTSDDRSLLVGHRPIEQ